MPRCCVNAAVPRARLGRIRSCNALFGRPRDRPRKIQRAIVLAHGARSRLQHGIPPFRRFIRCSSRARAVSAPPVRNRCASFDPAAPRFRPSICSKWKGFRAPVRRAYGMTEASHQMTSNPLPPDPRKPGSVGLATGIRCSKVMDPEGNILPPGIHPAKWLSAARAWWRATRTTPKPTQHHSPERLVPHRRSGHPRRRRISHADRASQRND